MVRFFWKLILFYWLVLNGQWIRDKLLRYGKTFGYFIHLLPNLPLHKLIVCIEYPNLLIGSEGFQRDTLVNYLFTLTKANNILGIKIAPYVGDELTWPFNLHGDFLMSSTYSIIVTYLGGISIRKTMWNLIWKSIWKI